MNRPGYIKTHVRAENRCKWTPISQQGEHFPFIIFWIPQKDLLEIRTRFVETLFVLNLIPITVRTEVFDNFIVIQRISRTMDKRKNQSLDDLLAYKHKNIARTNEVSNINILTILLVFEI